MGNRVSLLLAWLANILPGVGILLVPNRATIHTVFAVGYMMWGITAWFFTIVGVGLFFLLPCQLVACIHSVILASQYNNTLDAEKAALAGTLQDVQTQLDDATGGGSSELGDLATGVAEPKPAKPVLTPDDHRRLAREAREKAKLGDIANF